MAVEYAHQHQAAMAVAWQFQAEDQATLTDGFARLAILLGAAGRAMDPRDPVGSVHAVLADSGPPWLLIFDNASDLAALRAFLPPAGNGQVLITSQSAVWPQGHGLEVPVLETNVAAGFLTTRTRDPDHHSAVGLATELEGLPLALEQAAAYILATASSLSEYLSLFRERQADLLGRGEPTGVGGMAASRRRADKRLGP